MEAIDLSNYDLEALNVVLKFLHDETETASMWDLRKETTNESIS